MSDLRTNQTGGDTAPVDAFVSLPEGDREDAKYVVKNVTVPRDEIEQRYTVVLSTHEELRPVRALVTRLFNSFGLRRPDTDPPS